jgi:hypothetical protein
MLQPALVIAVDTKENAERAPREPNLEVMLKLGKFKNR